MQKSALVLFFLLFSSLPLFAHPLNVAYVDIAIGEKEIDFLLSVNLFELDLFLSLDQNQDAIVDQKEVDAKSSEIVEYLRGKVKATVGREPLPLEVRSLQIGRSADGKQVLEAKFLFRSNQPISDFAIQCEPLTELGPDHKTLAKISRRGRIEQFVFQKGVVYEGKKRGLLAYLIQFLQLGIVHIFTGYDHIAFLFGLLLMGGRLLNILKIVTSFTLAHSITLSLAALDVVSLPSKLIEAGIALSIVYIALENLLFTTFDKRWLVSFFFGLVHGFGFANVLKAMHLPRSGLVSSLFSFNFGVEIGQVILVLIIVPSLFVLSRKPVHRVIVRSASVLILCAGLLWFYQRAF